MKETLATQGKEYFAVIYTVNKHEPAQGHGYPGYSYTENQYEEIGDRETLEKWLIDNHNSSYPKKDYKVVRCTPLDVQVNVTIKPVIENFQPRY